MPRKKVKLNADGYEADPNDPDWDNLSEVSESSSFMTREEGEQLHAENPELTTIEEVQAKWEEIRSYYSRSTCRAAVRQLLEAHRPSEGWKIDAAVIFGSGTPSTRWKGYRDTTMLQLAVFLDIVQYLGEDSGQAIASVFAQDPQYKDLDTSLLTRLGIAVVKDPVGQRMISRHVFGFTAGFSMDGDIMGQCAHLWPRLWVGCPTDVVVESAQKSAESEYWSEQGVDEETVLREHAQRIARVRAFAEAHESIEFPEIDQPEHDPNFEQNHRWNVNLYDHNIWKIYFETKSTEEEMRSQARESCAVCDGGRRDEWRQASFARGDKYANENKSEHDRESERIEEESRKERWFRDHVSS